MDCITVHQLLNEYIEGNLTHKLSQSLAEHLRECKNCADEEELLRMLVSSLRSLPRRSASPGFADAVMEKLLTLEEASSIAASAKEAGLISILVSRSGLKPSWLGVKMMLRSARITERYIPRPTVRLRIGKDRSRSLTKLPLALGFRW